MKSLCLQVGLPLASSRVTCRPREYEKDTIQIPALCNVSRAVGLFAENRITLELLGKRGGEARAEKLLKEQRSEMERKAVKARWHKKW